MHHVTMMRRSTSIAKLVAVATVAGLGMSETTSPKPKSPTLVTGPLVHPEDEQVRKRSKAKAAKVAGVT